MDNLNLLAKAVDVGLWSLGLVMAFGLLYVTLVAIDSGKVGINTIPVGNPVSTIFFTLLFKVTKTPQSVFYSYKNPLQRAKYIYIVSGFAISSLIAFAYFGNGLFHTLGRKIDSPDDPWIGRSIIDKRVFSDPVLLIFGLFMAGVVVLTPFFLLWKYGSKSKNK